jgi:hypothetical protein
MAVNDPNEIANAAQTILDTIVSTFAEYNVALPTRQYLAVGALGHTVHDAEQLTVSWDLMYSGSPGMQALAPIIYTENTHTSTFVVEIVRAVPTPPNGRGMPDASAMTTAAIIKMVDGRLMFEAGMRSLALSWNKHGIVDIQSGVPQGGYQATIMNIILSI